MKYVVSWTLRRTLALTIAFVSALLSANPAAGQVRRRLVDRLPLKTPRCASVSGTAGVAISLDGGVSMLPREGVLRGTVYSFGLVVLDPPGTLLAVHGEELLKSTDVGCSWRPVASFPSGTFPPFLVAAPGGRAYAWSPNRSDLFIYDGALRRLNPPTNAIVGFGVDPVAAEHVRLADGEGRIWESFDAGSSWTVRGGLKLSLPLLYEVEFGRDLDHVVAGAAHSGAWVSGDGGVTWIRASGLSHDSTAFVNVMSLAISPADPDVVWAMGIDLSEENEPHHGRHIYRSIDGGASYAPVVDESSTVKLVNGPLLSPHPSDSAALYFVFGTWFANYGTDLFRFDAVARRLDVSHFDVDGIDSIAYHPVQPEVMFMGLDSVETR